MAFPIQPLNLPDTIRPAQFNFATAFGGLGDAIAEARGRQALNSALAQATDAQGNLDFGKAGAALAQAGMVDQARPLLALALQKQAADRAEAGQAETRRHNLAVEGIAGQKVAQGPVDPAKRFGKAPSGYRFTDSGELEPIPGGPQAAKIQLSVEGELSDAAAKRMAEQYRAGNEGVLTGLRTNPKNFAKVQNEIARQNDEAGTSGTDQAMRNAEYFGTKAGQRTLGTRSTNIELAATEFKQMLPIATEASNAVNRTNYPNLNRVIQAWQEGTGDPNIVAFGSAVNTLVNTYARAISPTGVATVEQRNHARELLNKAWSQGQFGAATAIMEREIDAALAAPGEVNKHMRSRFTGKGETPAPAAPAQAAPTAPERKVQNREEANQVVGAVRARLRELIAGGADPAAALEAANARLRALGAPPIASP